MRIGILTFHRAVNYGAALQAYSLLRYLSRQCHDVVLIDYYPREDEKDYDIFRSMISLKNVLYNFLVFPYSIKIRRKKQRFFISYKNILYLHEDIIIMKNYAVKLLT